MEELDYLKSVLKNGKSLDINFGTYSRVYFHSNENLSQYIPDMSNKKVLTVSSSGDHLLNLMGKGCTNIDTFDINRISPLYSDLKLYSVLALKPQNSYIFLSTLDKNLFFKFKRYLPDNERHFFNYLYKNFDIDDIASFLFNIQGVDFIKNNNYFDIDVLLRIKKNLSHLRHNHFCCDMFSLNNYLTHNYDAIFLSNISEYVYDVDKFVRFISELKKKLNRNGCIYYAYLYDNNLQYPLDMVRSINKNFFSDFDPYIYYNIINDTEVINVESAMNPGTSKDSVLVLRK